MPVHERLSPTVPWVQVTATDADYDQADPGLLRSLHHQLQLIRGFEEYTLELAGKGLIHGPLHSSVGQEGEAVGSIALLRDSDTINGSHRGHHQFLAKSLNHVAREGIDLSRPLTAPVTEVLLRTLAEICGLARGYCHGRGGSMHLQWAAAGAMGTNAIVGGGVPQMLGFAWAMKQAGTDDVAVTCYGDGAANIGSVLESFNLAAAWKLPVVFFAENNHYAVATTVEEATADARLSARGPGFGIASWRTDGMDTYGVHLTMREALDHVRAGRGPALVEVDTYRHYHQNGPFPGSAFGYRSKQEEASWRERDPLVVLGRQLARLGIHTAGELEELAEVAKRVMREIGSVILEDVPGGKPGEQRIRAAEWPRGDFVDVGVRGDLRELAGLRYEEELEFRGRLDRMKFVDAVSGVLRRRFDADGRYVILGEDIHKLNGGTNGATRGLADAHRDRTLGTPISENAFAGLGLGIALDGRYRPIVEFMYADFMWVAADQVFNQIGKVRHMFGGAANVPLVLRSKVAMGTGYGSQHSMDPAGIYATSPGWRIVAPSTPYDYVGLMNTALACEDPVLVIEHVELYNSLGIGPVDDFDYHLPLGRAAIRRRGAAVTVIAYLNMVGKSLQAVEQAGVDAEVIDLRWLDRASLDWDTVATSVRKTNNVLIVEQGAVGTSYGGWLADAIQRRLFDHLDQPVQRVTGAETSPSISRVLEAAACADTADIVAALNTITA